MRDWDQPQTDPPDILCTTISGRAIGPQPHNSSRNIYYVWLHPRPRARVKPTDTPAFREEIFKVVSDIDLRWEREEDWQSPQGCLFQDFAQYPTVAKYLQSMRFFPKRHWRPGGTIEKTWPVGADWLIFTARGGAYSEEAMVNALFVLIAKKMKKYESKPPQVRMDEFYLLIHYHQALLYNTPVETLRFKFADAARAGTVFIGDDPGVFSKVFLLLAIEPGERVYQLYPSNVLNSM